MLISGCFVVRNVFIKEIQSEEVTNNLYQKYLNLNYHLPFLGIDYFHFIVCKYPLHLTIMSLTQASNQQRGKIYKGDPNQ